MQINTKNHLRNVLLLQRNNHYNLNNSIECSLQLIKQFQQLDITIDKKIVSFYWPQDNEINPIYLAIYLRAEGVKLALPYSFKSYKLLSFHQWDFGYHLVKDENCIPASCSKELIPDILLIPLVGFDSSGKRLGSGQGYYDFTLAQWAREGLNPIKIGLAYSFQEVSCLPEEPHDVRLDYVLTPEKIFISK